MPKSILAFDIGGTGLKAALLDNQGGLWTEPLWLKTPPALTPKRLIAALLELTKTVPQKYDRIAVGFPGVIRRGVVLTCPTLGNTLHGMNLEAEVARAFKHPVRAVNDAEMQGFATIRGKGIELVVTLGTGFGSALFDGGHSTPHLELSTHGFRKDQTYNEQLGDAARRRVGNKKWNHRVEKAIESLDRLTHFDHLYLGGGNSAHVTLKLPKSVSIAPNVNGLRGGAWVWNQDRA